MLAACSFVACAGEGEDIELPDTIVDGAADSWGSPTQFGRLFEGIWQRGELDPSRNLAFPAWHFALDGDANVLITTRQAPTDEPELTASVIYLYKQQTTGTWKRIAKTTPGGGFASLRRSLDEGYYRVIVKGVAADARGELMLRRECSGAGCANGEQCLVGDAFHDLVGVNHGAVIDYGSRTLTAQSQLNEATKAQIIAAVRVAAGCNDGRSSVRRGRRPRDQSLPAVG